MAHKSFYLRLTWLPRDSCPVIRARFFLIIPKLASAVSDNARASENRYLLLLLILLLELVAFPPVFRYEAFSWVNSSTIQLIYTCGPHFHFLYIIDQTKYLELFQIQSFKNKSTYIGHTEGQIGGRQRGRIRTHRAEKHIWTSFT